LNERGDVRRIRRRDFVIPTIQARHRDCPAANAGEK
jgi:hypothetical protein